jgi:hypothetical protein
MGGVWSYCCGGDSDSDQGESGERTRLIRSDALLIIVARAGSASFC